MIEGSQTPASTPAPSLHDALSASFDALEKAQPETAAPVVDTPAPAPAADTTPSAAPAPSTPKVDADGRVRAPDGKFAKTSGDSPPVTPAPAATPSQLPKGWKAEHRPIWDKMRAGQPLTAVEADTIEKFTAEREDEFYKGVSTYKTEWDKARPVQEALHPYREMLTRANATPEQFVGMAAKMHHTMTSGTKEEKLSELVRFAKAYGVEMNDLLQDGGDGKLYWNQSYFAQQQPQNKPLTADDVQKILAQDRAQNQLHQQVQQFIEAKDGGGNALHPHYKAVWQTMDGLLRSGTVKDLPAAYQFALKLPQHSDLQPAPAPQPAVNDAEKARQAKEAAERAKRNAVSPRNEASTALATAPAQRGSLRADIERFAEGLGNGGRV